MRISLVNHQFFIIRFLLGLKKELAILTFQHEQPAIKQQQTSYQLKNKSMNGVKSKQQHPPLCPKTQKASIISTESLPISRPPRYNKNQRLTAPLPTTPSVYALPTNPPLPPSNIHTQPSENLKQVKQEIYRKQYQQYSRKNYQKKSKFQDKEGKIQSDLLGKLKKKRNQSVQEERKFKSKSALDYAKYFIKQVSNTPTQPSSREPQPTHPDQHLPCSEQELISKINNSNTQEDQTVSRREESRQKHRASIMQKLKLLKSTRAKSSKNGISLERELIPSIDKRSVDKSRSKKISGNINSIGSNQSIVARMKARSRNRRIVLKVRQLNQTTPFQEQMSLMLNSLMDRSHSERAQISQKIELHIELLNFLPSYVKQFKEIYQQVECWDQLLFLTYKKFYLQRKKIQQAISTQSSFSPFSLPFAYISPIQLRNYSNSLAGVQLQQKIKNQNLNIERALRELYNHIIQKSGKYINLLEVDNFSCEIYWLMGQEVRLLLGQGGEEQIKDDQQVRWRRVGLILKCFYLIAFMNGENVDIEAILMGNEVHMQQVQIFEKFLQNLTE